jgi:hypothetical protein
MSSNPFRYQPITIWVSVKTEQPHGVHFQGEAPINPQPGQDPPKVPDRG